MDGFAAAIKESQSPGELLGSARHHVRRGEVLPEGFVCDLFFVRVQKLGSRFVHKEWLEIAEMAPPGSALERYARRRVLEVV